MIYDLNKIKIGMVLSFKNEGGLIGDRIVKYQKDMGFEIPSSEQTHIGLSLGGPWVVEATFPKVRISNILEVYQGREITFLMYKSESFGKRCRYKVALWCVTRIGLKYGVWGLMGFYLKMLIPIFWKNPLASSSSPFCSYLVAWAFRKCGFDPWPGVSSDMITPAHYLACGNFDIVSVAEGIGRD